MMTYKEFLGAFAPLTIIYKSEISNEILTIYYELLKNYTPNDLKMACLEVLKTDKFLNLPRPATLIQILNGATSKEQKADIECLRAWGVADNARNRIGAYKSVCFKDKLIMVTIKLSFGGWIEFCNSADKFDKKNFIDTYKTLFLSNEKIEFNNHYLKGICEKDAGFDPNIGGACVEMIGFVGMQKLTYSKFDKFVKTQEKLLTNFKKSENFVKLLERVQN